MTRRPSEISIARPLVEHLRGQGWEMFQQVRFDGAVADIVAKRPESSICLAIETKVEMSWHLIGQAAHWREHANYVAVGTPPVSSYESDRWAADLRALKIGWFVLGRFISEKVKAPPQRPDVGPLSYACREEHKHFAPAGSQHEYFTDRRAAVAELEALVRSNPYCTVKFAAERLPHLFAAPDDEARAKLLRKAAKKLELGAVRTRNWKLYVDESAADCAAEAQSA